MRRVLKPAILATVLGSLALAVWVWQTPAFADPVPGPGARVFCLRITDIQKVASDPQSDRFRFELEFLNWTNQKANDAEIMLALPNPDGIVVAAAGEDANGRPLKTVDIPGSASELEDIDGDGILDALENNGVPDLGFFDNANGRLDNDPIPGNLNPTNNWTHDKSSSHVNWHGGTPIQPLDLVGGGNAVVLGLPGVSGIMPDGTVVPTEGIDNGGNVLDGFTLTLDDFDAGDTAVLNWFLTSGGVPIGTAAGGNPFGFGVVILSRVDGGPLPGPVFAGNVGVNQSTLNFFDSVSTVPDPAQFAAEFGPSLTAQFMNAGDNTFNAPVNAELLATPTPTSPPPTPIEVGGISRDVGDGALPLNDEKGTRRSSGAPTALMAAASALGLALSGAAWCARRRRSA